MKYKFNFLVLIFAFSGLYVSGQDLHFTNYSFAPLYLNPSYTGNYSGSFRLGLVYREQYSSFIQKPYRSPMLFMDSPIIKGLRKNHWVGAGMGVYFDRAGDLGLQNLGLLGSASYNIGWGKPNRQVLSVGLEIGQVQRQVASPDKAKFDDQLSGVVGQSQDLMLIQDYKDGYPDYNVGISYSLQTSTYSALEIGASSFHITNPKIKFKNGQYENPVPRRINLHASYGIDLNDEISLIPRTVISTMEKNTNIQLQVLMDFRFFNTSQEKSKTKTPKNIKNIQFGLGYRFGDALELLIGANYKNWLVGLSYDYTVSDAADFNNNYGGFEIGIQRTFVIYKKPKVNPKVFCPRF
ncbi:MAG: PorP/SprF family type IX secretion system membrane protein [Bacteroidota bacterium]|nr:PorP/SprF family type IX secretion system membrane protein [Bacteroidota bacterium]